MPASSVSRCGMSDIVCRRLSRRPVSAVHDAVPRCLTSDTLAVPVLLLKPLVLIPLLVVMLAAPAVRY